ncbi:DUF547 domain-containing protein [Aquimarina sp. MMG015]|uniref:DUF547 domain-containing protein n=1 Tax=Aquimarina TaxID=290174 RepID=UPI00047FE1ED|nr:MULTISPECIES: DUF547 domain-containing protein [Aquimarina]AXT54265.1 DUF547 domain-containing protein [Aquimarina sp. AD1]MBQ4804200.1 DUF547 domain-containing protein [Aquimarina sp. MMG015]
MKKTYLLLAIITLSSFISSIHAQKKHIDHMVWDQLLLLNVSNDGKVDYKGFIRDKFLFDKYFTSLSTNYPSENSENSEKLAYWVNLYNAIVMKMIIDHYPIKSINDLKNPWKKKSIEINNIKYSLDDIEHTILRKMDEPRIHFLLNCAATSSPKLWNRAYTNRNITKALEERTIEYINDPSKNIITNNEVNISKVFDWYAKDFDNGDIKSYINRYSKVKIDKSSKINYLEYDWSLNERE